MKRRLLILCLAVSSLSASAVASAATSSAVASLQGTLTGGIDPVTVTLPVVNLISTTATITYKINSGPFQTIPASTSPSSFTVNQGDTFGIAAVAAASSALPLYSRAWALQDVLISPNGNSGMMSLLANSSVQLQGIGAFGNAYTQLTTVEALGAAFFATHFDGKPTSFDFSGDMTFQSKLFAEASVPIPEPVALVLTFLGASACISCTRQMSRRIRA